MKMGTGKKRVKADEKKLAAEQPAEEKYLFSFPSGLPSTFMALN